MVGREGWGGCFSVMRASIGKSRIGRKRGAAGEEGEAVRDQPAKQESFSLFSLTVLDVGRAKALLKPFGGDF